MDNNTLNEDNFHIVLGEDNNIEPIGPKRCKKCKTGDVCSILSTILAVYRLGIQLQVEECPYYSKGIKC